MKTVGLVTFHGAYNYGSVLLTYALQQALGEAGVEAKVIDYRPLKQQCMYRLPILVGKSWVKRTIERVLWMPFMKDMQEKQHRFDLFRTKRLKMTTSLQSIRDVEKECGTYDYVMAGGDQIWNPGCHEFEWFYYLDFVTKGHKVAYAPSMAGGATAKLDTTIEQHIHRCVEQFACVGVRDEATQAFFGKGFPVIADPVFLFSGEFWDRLIKDDAERNNVDDYILFYDPFDDDEAINYAKQMANKYVCKVINTNIYKVFGVNKRSFEYRLQTGPVDFLQLISNARLCVGRSFHLAAFCLIFHKPCHITNGMQDVRVRELVSQLMPQKNGGKDLHIDVTDYNDDFECRMAQYRRTANSFLAEVINA